MIRLGPELIHFRQPQQITGPQKPRNPTNRPMTNLIRGQAIANGQAGCEGNRRRKSSWMFGQANAIYSGAKNEHKNGGPNSGPP